MRIFPEPLRDPGLPPDLEGTSKKPDAEHRFDPPLLAPPRARMSASKKKPTSNGPRNDGVTWCDRVASTNARKNKELGTKLQPVPFP
jgi:hypothetical protein